MPNDTNTVFLALLRRAEQIDAEFLEATFVDTGGLKGLLSASDHQIIYGRRGTGKTHALRYFESDRLRAADLAIYIDLRTIGSSGGLYADPAVPLAQRATQLLLDTLSAMHQALFATAVEGTGNINLRSAGTALDKLHDEIARVTVSEAPPTSGDASPASPNREADSRRHTVRFASISTQLRKVIDAFGCPRLWILLDEWSTLPVDLQPFLADLLRRSIFPLRQVTVKIGAVLHRSHFLIPTTHPSYIGIEVGSDASADLDLDDLMVYEHDPKHAVMFFRELIFRHVNAVSKGMRLSRRYSTASALIEAAFDNRSAFEELVKAAEGVPRDAIGILVSAAQRAGAAAITVRDIRFAAKRWFERDKEVAIPDRARALFQWILGHVLSHRDARVFLVKDSPHDELLAMLVDARVLHLVAREIASEDRPTALYTMYKVDYGCYVKLLSGKRTPVGGRRPEMATLRRLKAGGMTLEQAGSAHRIPVIELEQFRREEKATR